MPTTMPVPSGYCSTRVAQAKILVKFKGVHNDIFRPGLLHNSDLLILGKAALLLNDLETPRPQSLEGAIRRSQLSCMSRDRKTASAVSDEVLDMEDKTAKAHLNEKLRGAGRRSVGVAAG